MLEINSIKKIYKAGDMQVKALENVSFTFREKEFASILGPSGCGKTTLLNIIGGLDRYTSGDIIVNGISTKDFKDKDWDTYRNHHIGFVFQSYNLILHLTVLENIELALSIAGLPKKVKHKMALNALIKVGLLDQAKKKPNQLSGGQMQRVAIARALVNNPEIILADEPTGALDTETSIQVLNLLKEISKEHLVIMVTHNEDLAYKYSDRIIKLLDGEVQSDTKPVTKAELKKASKSDKPKKKSAMRFITAFNLSLKNLLTKKAKTLLTSFAGSIGIIGIALVLAVSSGLTNYINQLQSDTLSGYPIAVSTVAIDFDSISSAIGSGQSQTEFPEDEEITAYNYADVIGRLGHFNYLNDSFLEYIQDFVDQDMAKPETQQVLNSSQICYSNAMHVLSKNEDDEVSLIDTTVSTSSLSGATTSLFFEGLNDTEYLLNSYDVLAGEFPTNSTQLALVIPENNRFPTSTLQRLGIEYSTAPDDSIVPIQFSDIIGKSYKLIHNDEFYTAQLDADNNITSFVPATPSLSLYENENNTTLTISAVLRVKEEATASILNEGLMYLPLLGDEFRESCRLSSIATVTRTNKLFYMPYVVNVSEIKQYLGASEDTFVFSTPQQVVDYVNHTYGLVMSEDEAINLGLQQVGASTLPIGIYFYPKTFDAKDTITSYINAWNDTDEGQNNKIIYTDATEILSSTMGQLIDIISYVLIAFAAISLIVSSIMIGIITYASVVERTKEIGVLRSIGARKKDISRVFNAETIMVGLSAGLIGICISYLLTIPINALLKSVSAGAVTTNLATLPIIYALILILISTFLTFVSGLIPSRIASKKDPVRALRSE